MRRQRVLFLCTGNASRSQMAEAFLRKYAGDIFEIHSAGLKPKGVHPLTLQVMKDVGIDISAHTSKDIVMYLGNTLFQYVITLCDDADKDCPTIWDGVNTRLRWSFEDPAQSEGTEEEKLAKFRKVRDSIENKIRGWVARRTFIDPERIRTSMLAPKPHLFNDNTRKELHNYQVLVSNIDCYQACTSYPSTNDSYQNKTNYSGKKSNYR